MLKRIVVVAGELPTLARILFCKYLPFLLHIYIFIYNTMTVVGDGAEACSTRRVTNILSFVGAVLGLREGRASRRLARAVRCGVSDGILHAYSGRKTRN